MSQIILDPTNAIASISHPDPPTKIPRKIRDFGFWPNTQAWHPGDLVLVSAIKPSFVSEHIIRVQKTKYADEDARWHHAGVYIGDNFICEALRSGVIHTSIDKYIDIHKIRVRRDFSLDLEEGYKIAIEALCRLHYKYSLGSIVKLLYQSKFDAHLQPRDFSSATTICSQLFADAYGAVTRRTIDKRADIPITPAALSANSILKDVELSWQNL